MEISNNDLIEVALSKIPEWDGTETDRLYVSRGSGSYAYACLGNAFIFCDWDFVCSYKMFQARKRVLEDLR